MESNLCTSKKLDYDLVWKQEQEAFAKESDEDIVIRLLEKEDFNKGHLQVLAQLTKIGDITKEAYEKRFDEMFPKRADVYRIVVIVDKKKDKVIGTGTLFVEKKFLR